MNVILQSISPTIVYPKWYQFWKKPTAILMIDTWTDHLCTKGSRYRSPFGILEVYHSSQIPGEFDERKRIRTFFSLIEKQIVRTLGNKFIITIVNI